MSRLPPIAARIAETPEGQSMLRAFERLCEIETDTDAIELDLASLAVGSRLTVLQRNIDRNRDEAMRINIRSDGVRAAPRPSPPGGTGGGGGAVPRDPDAGEGDPGTGPPAAVRHPGNHLDVVLAAHALFPVSTACAPPEGNGSFAFLNEVVRRLKLQSSRWGFGCVRSNCSETRTDQVLYYAGIPMPPPSPNDFFYNFDIIGSVCGTNPTPQWTDKSAPGRGTSTRWKANR